MPVSHGAKSRQVSPTGSEKMGLLFGGPLQTCSKFENLPLPNPWGRGVKFIRPLGDLNIPNPKNFGGPPVQFGGARGVKLFSFPPSRLKTLCQIFVSLSHVRHVDTPYIV